MSVVSVILRNLLGFDLLIFLAAGLNGWCYMAARRRAAQLYDELNRVIFVPIYHGEVQAKRLEKEKLDVERLVRLRQRAESLYALFVNGTAIFPLLGILGTVVSLLPMVSQLGDMQTNFFTALTSTFWGLVFAIAFKLCDAFLSARMEDNDKNVTLLLERLRQEAEERAHETA